MSHLKQSELNFLADNPQLDGTDLAHPAYWRGQEDAMLIIAQQIHEILDGKLPLVPVKEPWHSARELLIEHVKGIV